MRVLGYDPFLSKERAQELGIEMLPTVHEMLPHVDYLTVHTPLTPETRNLIGAKEIEMMRPGVRLINCARGGIYDEAALVEGLKSGKLAGVALDVFANEPCTNSPLFGMPGVLATPHLGASTEEAQTQVAAEGAQLLIDFLTHRRDPARGERRGDRSQEARRPARRPRRGLPLGIAVVAIRSQSGQGLPFDLSRRGRGQGHQAADGDRGRRVVAARAGGRGQFRQRRGVAPRAGHRTGRAIDDRPRGVQLRDPGRIGDARRGPTRRPARCSVTTWPAWSSSAISGSTPISTAF